MAQSGVQRDGAALREASQYDARRGDATGPLACDQRLDQGLRRADACRILAAAAHLQDVVPRAHAHAHVDGHRAHGRVRKNEAQPGVRRQAQFRHHRFEVVAVGAQAMQPDHCRIGRASGLDFNRFGQWRHAGFGRNADFGLKAFTTASSVSM